MPKIEFESARKKKDQDIKALRSAADELAVVEEVDNAIQQAAEKGASEVHFEPYETKMVVRNRVQGELIIQRAIKGKLKGNVVNRIKVLGGMDITKTKIPQSGFFRATLGDRAIELYGHTMPTMYGEKVVVCIQYKKSATMRMQELGMTKTMMTNFQKSLLQRNGMILVSGSPGSGRRTTAYSCVLELLQETQLAMGWDPVIKYEVERMVQAKPEEKDEFSFADGIKAMMRQEPDIAYVGDIQCLDDVLACIQGTFAKRVVLCRMTSNNAISAMQNILDMGIQPFLLVASVKASLNQRLLRRLCPHCRVPYEPEKAIELELGFRLPPDSHFYRPKGCEKCGNSGFVGFAAIFELYLPSEEVNKMIVAKEPLQTIRQQAMQEKMASLKMDGIMKALRGWVTLEDVLLSL